MRCHSKLIMIFNYKVKRSSAEYLQDIPQITTYIYYAYIRLYINAIFIFINLQGIRGEPIHNLHVYMYI